MIDIFKQGLEIMAFDSLGKFENNYAIQFFRQGLENYAIRFFGQGLEIIIPFDSLGKA